MSTRTEQKRRAQRQRRREKLVHRVEVTLSCHNDRDRAIYDFLEALPAGQGAEFIRRAIFQAMQASHAPAPPADPAEQLDGLYHELAAQRQEATDQLAAMYAELAALRQEMSTARSAPTAPPPRPPVYEPPPSSSQGRGQPSPAPAPGFTEVDTLPDDDAAPVASSGLDMSRKRKRPGRPAVAMPPTLPELDSTPKLDAKTAAAILFTSAKQFGEEYLTG